MFDSEEDAYWWVLCIEEHFEMRETLNEEKPTEGWKLLRGRARQRLH